MYGMGLAFHDSNTQVRGSKREDGKLHRLTASQMTSHGLSVAVAYYLFTKQKKIQPLLKHAMTFLFFLTVNHTAAF